MPIRSKTRRIQKWLQLLRWNKPSGRLILLIPAGWALWLAPSGPPQGELVALIIAGGIFTSGAGCIANDIWDRRIDSKVTRTMQRPLADGSVRIETALILLFTMLLLSLLVVTALPVQSRSLCLGLALLALPPILIYPSAKRWFFYPQALLALCWGFAVLIPWAASEYSLSGGWPLLSCWGATLMWTFGFDTIYAMADQNDDAKIGMQSSAINLGERALPIVAISYAFACTLLASGAVLAGIGWPFWPIWIIASLGMQYEVLVVKKSKGSLKVFGRHFQYQVWLGSLLLLGLIMGRVA